MPFYDNWAGLQVMSFPLPEDKQLRRLASSLYQELHWMRMVYGRAEKYELLLPVERAIRASAFKDKLQGTDITYLRDIDRPMLAKPLQLREIP